MQKNVFSLSWGPDGGRVCQGQIQPSRLAVNFISLPMEMGNRHVETDGRSRTLSDYNFHGNQTGMGGRQSVEVISPGHSPRDESVHSPALPFMAFRSQRLGSWRVSHDRLDSVDH